MTRRILLVSFSALGLIAAAQTGCDDTAAGSQRIDGSMTDDAGDTGTIDTSMPDTTETAPDTTGDTDSIDPPETPCAGNNDCTPPEICQIRVDSSGAIDQICGPIIGGGVPGSMCTADSECQSGLCLNGACAAPCDMDTDCPDNFVCEQQMVGNETIGVCVGAPVPCLSASDCAAGEACVVDRSGSSLGLFCGTPVGGGGVGTMCTSDAECTSNLCLGGICTDPCERPNDCPTGDGFTCEGVDIPLGAGGTATGQVCQPLPPDACLSDFDCSGGERCIAEKTSTDLGFVCGTPNPGGREVGEICAGDADCAQNLCVDGTCAAPCENDARDCPTDNSCTTIDVELGGGLTDSASLCEAPVECQEDDACRVSEVCFIRKDATDLFLFCRDPNFGGADLAAPCSDDVDCASNLCFEGRFRDVCTEACIDDNDCGAAGYECTQQDVNAQDGTPVSIGLCTPLAPSPCDEQSDCAAGTSCAVVPNIAGNALESVCIPTSGGNNGVPCVDSDDCASQVCLNGACAAPCQSANQCTANQICRDNTVSSSGLMGTFQVCETPPDVVCDSSADCSATNRVCGTIRQNTGGTAIETACRFPNTGQANLGDACTMGGDCFHNICMDGITSGECSVVCGTDGDCASGQTCVGFGFNPGPTTVPLCVAACTDDGSCQTGTFPNRTCTITVDNKDTANPRVAQICSDPAGPADLGDSCATSNDCLSGLCLRTTLFDGTACTADAQCGAGSTCECPPSNPSCTTGKECATLQFACTRVCDGDSDCTNSTFGGNQLTGCSPNTFVGLPDGSTQQISTCAAQ